MLSIHNQFDRSMTLALQKSVKAKSSIKVRLYSQTRLFYFQLSLTIAIRRHHRAT